MRTMSIIACCVATAIVPSLTIAGTDSDWNNFGGNPQRNGLTTVNGPTNEDELWSNTDDVSIISWHPVTYEDNVFAIRENGFPFFGGTGAVDPIFAYDLNSGEFLWSVEVPFAGDPDEEWIAYIGGVNDGHIYAARGGSGRTTPVYAISIETQSIAWMSDYETVAGPQDGIVFGPDGDLIVGDFDNVVRIDATDGSTVWENSRACPVSGNCGAALFGNAVYIDQTVPGGQVITKFDFETGGEMYSSPLMPGFLAQNAPFVSADGSTVYYARAQNSPDVDFLYAFEDTGADFIEKWNRPVRWTTSHEHGIGPDGSIYTFLEGDEFVRLNPETGDVMHTAGVLNPIGSSLSPRTAISANGTVYVSNGWSSDPPGDGRVWAFSADLSIEFFSLELDRVNSGGPSLGQDGTLVVADRQGLYAYRAPSCAADLNGDGTVGPADLALLLGMWGPCARICDANLNGDSTVGPADLALLLGSWGPCL